MPDSFNAEEFAQLLKNWEPEELAIYNERMATNFSRAELENFTLTEAELMHSVLARLIPEQEGVDLVGFMDGHVEKNLGRGDRRPGMPPEKDLYKLGLAGIEQSAQAMYGQPFRELAGGEQDEVLKSIQHDKAPGSTWGQISGSYFFERFYAKALHGYLAHPRVWMRIGFPGSAYPEGYVWVNKGEVRQRHERAPGWDTL
jgi:gluconate 2-dehydrogenase gamma chain